MRSRKANQKILIAAVIVFGVLVVALVFLTNNPAKAPSITPTRIAAVATPTGPRPECGKVVRTDGSFPVINVSSCPPDTSVINRDRPWNAVHPRQEDIRGFSADCTDWFAYHTNQTGNWEIFRLIPNGSPQNLSRGGSDTSNIGPAVSPDHVSVAFSTDRDGNWEIYVAKADGSDTPQRVTYNSFAVDMDPIWSPDGSSIIYESIRKGNWDLFRFDVTTGGEEQLTDNAANDRFPVWHKDGNQVIYESEKDGRSQIYMTDITTGKTTKLSDGKGNDHAPLYSPDGSRIAFISVRGENKLPGLYVMNADGSSVSAISDPALAAANQSFSPDGRQIVYDGISGSMSSLYVYDLTTGKSTQLTDKSISSYAATWDCKGQNVVFTARTGENPNLFMLPIEANAHPANVSKDAKQLTTGTAASQFPVGASGIEYASKINIAASLMAKAATSG